MTKIYSFFLIMCFTFAGFSQNVTIPDNALKQALLNNSTINTNGDSEIQFSEAEAFTGSLNLYNLGIEDLTGIEKFVNLTGLNASNNNITSIDVSLNTELETLGLNVNNLSDLDVTNNIKLTALHFEDNNVSSIDLSKNILLTVLTCRINNLENLDLSANTKLQYLTVSKNNLQSIDISNLTDLTNFVCTGNQLTSLDVSKNLELTYLLCNENQIGSLDVSNNIKLETFVCSYNSLTSLIMASVSSVLTDFACNNNSIESIDVTGYPNLKVLTCSSNNLTEIDLSNNLKLTSAWIGYNSGITEIDISNQHLLTSFHAGGSVNVANINANNGNNHNMTTFYLLGSNPDVIVCVDDVTYATANFTNVDTTATFTEQCQISEEVVYIPDPNFKSRILNHNPIIDVNNDGEIQFSEAENFTGTLDVGNYDSSYENLITDITGLEAFINIKEFKSSEHEIEGSFDFSSNEDLTLLDLSGNNLSEVNLSSNTILVSLDLGANSSIQSLDISLNINLEYLSLRHTGLSTIDLSQNTKLIELEAFGSELNVLDLSKNLELIRLSLGGTNITTIDLANNTKLEYLEWQSNLYESLDLTSNINLQHFAGYGTAFSSLDLSNNINLDYLSLSANPNLEQLELSSNIKLKNLNLKDTNLANLDLTSNVLLETLDVRNMNLSELDLSLNDVLKYLYVGGNNFTNLDFSCLEQLRSVDVSNSDQLEFLNIRNTNTSTISYFVANNCPQLSNICVDDVNYANDNFLRIDDHTQFTERCSISACYLNIIRGIVQYDLNEDGCINASAMQGITITATLENGNSYSGITETDGSYYISVPESGSGDLSIASELPQGTQVPDALPFSFENLGNELYSDFCIQKSEAVDVRSYFYAPVDPRPGFTNGYFLYAKNFGSTEVSGTLKLDFDSEKVEFVSSIIAPAEQTENSVTFNYSNLKPFKFVTFLVRMRTLPPPTVNGDDILTYVATVTPIDNDIKPENNVTEVNLRVVNSYDPNDIAVMEGEEILEEQKDDYLNYRIRFQNTGTASAINVNIDNTLDDELDWNTFEPTISSHSYRTEIKNGKKIKFIFDNINLPDSTSDQVGSNGYIFYKIKPKFDVKIGDEFDNTADIFFDYNLPITTNTVRTTIVAPLATQEYDYGNFTAYPIPFKKELNIVLEKNKFIEKVKVYSLSGKIILSIDGENKSSLKIFTHNLKSGIYFLEIKTNEGFYYQKIIKA